MAAQDLEARIKVLEDIEVIRKIMAKYCYFVDTKDMQGLMALFVDDARADFGPWGAYKNKGEITKFFEGIPKALPFMMHMVHNHIIEVKGETATGEWYFELPATNSATNRAMWIAGKYTNEFAKVGGEWKFKAVTATFNYYTPYDEGWVKTKMFK